MNNDAISREALKKALANSTLIRDFNLQFDGIIGEIIDNAPTVEYTFEEAFQKTVCENKLYCPARPQGEWIANPLGDYVCNKCSWVVGKFERNFCPNCGAKMQKGGAE